MAQLPWRPNSAGEYDAACARCEIHVVLDRTGHRKISAYLALIPTKGVLLTIDMPVYGLVKGDRLEPSTALFDVMAFDSLDQFPHPVTFWRVSRETNAKHRNPIFDETIGVSVEDTLTVDSLHAVFLGPMKQFVKIVVWHLLLNEAYTSVGTQDQQVAVSMTMLARELDQWYKARHKARPEEMLTRLQQVSQRIFGKASEQKASIKGAEAWVWFNF